jgi:hypothetical protein
VVASGCACAYFILKNNPNADVNIIDYSTPLRTILPTGGGRCNLAHAEYDFRELTKNYPRGNKFLYSVFSQFSTADTLDFFEEIGIQTYVQDDNRIFPTSNSSKDVQEKMLHSIKKANIIREKALRIEVLEGKFKVVTDMNSYVFDKLVYSTGGHSGYEMIKRIGIKIIEPKPSLVGLVTREKLSQLMGIVVKNAYNRETGLSGDILFTHFGVSGPLVYKISSLKSRDKFPYELTFDLFPEEYDLQSVFNQNPHKFVKNVISDILPSKLGEFLIRQSDIEPDKKNHRINGVMRDRLDESIHYFKVNVISSQKDGETVTSGGVDLNEITPKTMESKTHKGLYFCGEVIDVDGYCGGFNLQNCWSTAYLTASNICKK